MATLLWFKRDLRVADHPALAFAAELGAPILPVYVAEPEYWALPDTSARHWAFTADCLEALRIALAGLGAPLLIRTGDVREVFEGLRRAHGITHLVSHEETGTLWTYARDRRVGDWARETGVTWTELPQSGVVRRLKARDRWAARRDAFMRADPVAVPKAVNAVQGVEGGRIPRARDLGLAPDGIKDRQSGGRPAALTLVDSFLTARGETYRSAMSSPVEGEDACSRLSPHFALGTLTVREVVQATAARQRAVRGQGGPWPGSLKSFQARLAWRDHFTQKLEDAPDLETRCLHSGYEGLRGDDPTRRAAWEAGETGIPFVDACMRYLTATGWLNFRMRSMLMSFASYHLWLDWRGTGPHLARMFTDYEPGIHWPQVQMQSGTTGMNTVRIYNPVKQGRDQDPTGAFTRAWVPELAAVPGRYLQEPWAWEGAASLRYPAPIVDVAEAARLARQRIWAVRRGPEFRAEAAGIIEKHASRKDRQGRFVNDRERKTRRKTAGDDRQLRMEF
ncbi:MAG: deoxyribodipyrimidine photolyase [Rhodobacteraceae bacterium]|nr:deoxyribodipyrimidine photolyase [Paracoccaceae bacterium]